LLHNRPELRTINSTRYHALPYPAACEIWINADLPRHERVVTVPHLVKHVALPSPTLSMDAVREGSYPEEKTSLSP